MKHALVVYESMFGNTQAVATAIADGLSGRMTVQLAEVGAAPSPVGPGVDLLVVGGPTHAFGLSRPSTRQDAAKQAGHPVVSQGIGIREWLDGLGAGSLDIPVATFDTRVSRPRLPGSAAHKAAKRLRGLGGRLALPAESFWVTATPGPMLAGEEERARQWGLRLAAAVAPVQDEPRAS